jgi:hypothetical protein
MRNAAVPRQTYLHVYCVRLVTFGSNSDAKSVIITSCSTLCLIPAALEYTCTFRDQNSSYVKCFKNFLIKQDFLNSMKRILFMLVLIVERVVSTFF